MQDNQNSPPTDPVTYVHGINAEAHQIGMLPMWVIFDHPTDFPNSFVARCNVTDADGVQLTENFIVAPTLSSIRMILRMAGLVCLTRHPDDDRKIVEAWL